MTKEEFYQGRSVAIEQWWLDSGLLPDELHWARLRVFDDGRADVCFYDEIGKFYGFDSEEYARYFLSEDEFDRFDYIDDEYVQICSISAEDELKYHELMRSAQPPYWQTVGNESFKYFGTY